MDSERKRSIASKGGYASAKANKTSNRGFASMDKNKQRMISSMGGKASRNARRRPEKDEQDAEGKDRVGEGDAFQKDLSSLEDEDEREIDNDDPATLSYSETDDDEDEGLGDGNLGRTTRGGVGDE